MDTQEFARKLKRFAIGKGNIQQFGLLMEFDLGGARSIFGKTGHFVSYEMKCKCGFNCSKLRWDGSCNLADLHSLLDFVWDDL